MRRIREENDHIKLIALGTYMGNDTIMDAIEVGAKAYLLKDAHWEDFFRAPRAVHKGESFIDPSVAAPVPRDQNTSRHPP